MDEVKLNNYLLSQKLRITHRNEEIIQKAGEYLSRLRNDIFRTETNIDEYKAIVNVNGPTLRKKASVNKDLLNRLDYINQEMNTTRERLVQVMMDLRINQEALEEIAYLEED